MTNFNMVADHVVRQAAEDTIFGASIQAQKAIAQYGFENVINSTIGALLDDQGKTTPKLIKQAMDK